MMVLPIGRRLSTPDRHGAPARTVSHSGHGKVAFATDDERTTEPGLPRRRAPPAGDAGRHIPATRSASPVFRGSDRAGGLVRGRDDRPAHARLVHPDAASPPPPS